MIFNDIAKFSLLPKMNPESGEYKTVDLKNKPHGYKQVKAKCCLLEHYKEECLSFQILCSQLWMPADVSCFSGSWVIFLRALEVTVVQEMQPQKFCVQLMSSSSWKKVCPWPVFLDTTHLSATAFIIYAS